MTHIKFIFVGCHAWRRTKPCSKEIESFLQLISYTPVLYVLMSNFQRKYAYQPKKQSSFWKKKKKKKSNQKENPPLLNVKMSIWTHLLFVFHTHSLDAYYLWNYISFQKSLETLLHLELLINSPAPTERSTFCVCMCVCACVCVCVC